MDTGSFVWAALATPGGVPYGSLPVGAKFRFRETDGAVFTKLKRGWYVAADGRKCRTGVKTAVVSVAA